MIIGVCGKMGSGKDYIVSNYIVPILERFGIRNIHLSFADQIKVNVIAKQNVPFEEVFINKNRNTRQLLQSEGTENGRDVFGNDIWIKHYDAWMKTFMTRGIQAIVTSDVRFRNEFDYIRSRNGLIIKIVAGERNESRLRKESVSDMNIYNKIKNHKSECDLDNVDDIMYDLVIDNDIGSVIDTLAIERLICSKLLL